ncbi:MAG: tetratricopeptide repeat protein [Vicinamibacterales bacterium]
MKQTRRSRPPAPAARPPEQGRSSTRGRWLAVILIVACGFLAYANTLDAPFLFDDEPSVVNNAQIRTLWPLTEALSPPRDTPVAGRPLVNLSFALNYAVGRLDVTGYRLVNVAIHVLAALVLFGIVRRTLGMPGLDRYRAAATGLALVVALVWLLHPLQSEAVAYITERSESLMGICYLLTLYSAVRALDPARRGRWMAAAVAACAAGMASKESMVTAPLMVCLYDRVFVFPSWRDALARRRRLYVALAATWALLAALMWSGPRSAVGFDNGTTPWVYLLNQAEIVTRYFWLTIWPRALVLDYGPPRPLTLTDVLVPGLLVVVICLITGVLLWRRPRAGFLGAWVLVTLAPTSTIVPIATEVGAERRMYLPLAAIAVMLVLGAYRLWQPKDAGQGDVEAVRAGRPPGGQQGAEGGAGREDQVVMPARRWVARGAVVVVCAVLGLGTLMRGREYASRLAMAQTIVERRPHGRAYFLLGTEMLLADGNRDEALAHLRLSARTYPGARYALGTELAAEGRAAEAIEELRQFVSAMPDGPAAVPAYDLMARMHLGEGRLDEAAAALQALVALAPRSAGAHALLGDIAVQHGRAREAIAHYERARGLQPASPQLLASLGLAHALSDDLPAAAALLAEAVALDPTFAEARRNLARAYLGMGQAREAADQARAVLALAPGDPLARSLLDQALALTSGGASR